MWHVGTLWINPRNITYIQDREVYIAPQRSEEKVPELALYFNGDAQGIALRGAERDVLLAYLAQHTTMHPPYVVPEDREDLPF